MAAQSYFILTSCYNNINGKLKGLIQKNRSDTVAAEPSSYNTKAYHWLRVVPKPTKGDWDMKRKSVVILIISLLLSGCSSKSTPSKGQEDSTIDTESLTENYTDAWSIEDLSFYDEEKKESVFLTKEHSQNIDLQTYRNVRIGDRATTALKKYNLSDFEFGFDPMKYIKSDTKNKEAEEVADELAQKYESLSASDGIRS